MPAKNFKYGLYFCTINDELIIFGMHTLPMKPFQMTPELMTDLVTLTMTCILKIAMILDCLADSGIMSASQTHFLKIETV